MRTLRSGCSIVSSCLAVLRPAHLQAEVWRGKPSRHLRRARRARALMKPRSLPEVAGLLLPTRQAGKCQAGECHRRHHQRPAFSAVADESRCLLSLPEAVSRLRQTLQAGQAGECQAGECHRRPHQCPTFSAAAVAVAAVVAVAGLAVAVVGLAVAAVRHPALRLPGAAGAAAQTSR